MFLKKYVPPLFILVCFLFSSKATGQSLKTKISGLITEVDGSSVFGATVLLQSTNTGAITEADGSFELIGEFYGEHVLQVSYLGYTTVLHKLSLKKGSSYTVNISIEENNVDLEEVIVTGKSVVQQVKERAYNVSVVDAKKLHNTSLDLGHALDRVSGVRVRESGGVGSQMSFSLNGFKGNQIRFFIDGVPMDNFGSSFQINNIPISLAERIEVYKGVVPIGLGSDALGGAINIITNTYKKNHLEASYSYGSFNTHRSSINAIYVGKSGFTAQINAFQNYSDNNYKVNVDVADLTTGEYFPDQTVKRFHDTYHNESVLFNMGVVNKSFADQLLFGITLGQNYREIQTGARIVSVFGTWHRKGTIIMPSVKYKKDDLFINGLDFRFNANLNLGQEKNIDTINRRYNWFGDYKEYDTPGGERSYSRYNYKNNAGVSTANLSYKISEHHNVVLSNTFNTFDRVGHNELDHDNETYEQPKKTQKNIIGLGYDYKNKNWNASLFLKQYGQKNKFAQPYNPTGNYGDVAYRNQTNKFKSTGYGLAVTHFMNENLQLKISYEKSYRLPGSDELFGDVINLRGNLDLKPESSDNYNLGTSFWWYPKKNHQFNFNASGFFRKAIDFIRPRLDANQTMQIMDNLGSVTSLGIEGEIRYQFNNRLSMGTNMTYQNLRNNTKYEDGQTTVSVVYKDRIPNMPYLYGNADVSYTFPNLWNREHQLSIGYNALYVHAFYLYWPSLGSSKLDVPEQISHDINLTYSFTKNLQVTLECRNMLNKTLYDNFSLQKPGRSFTGKIKYTFF
ncbi:Outer membrane receptor proteins, mostly Fe transport [Arenibacter nanhaiticus]|uniref:Outer membrane receptor proteins, mostly Fe transport n=1 Tax=Arenibacter nanhaiticus TaxID=558155 RepID=A0A1M6BYE2_9FLAO|nr:TonB-dependent receptor [Arenibacter nanhaiticus]SHI53740.1 Outer membrane receptor proteins, mostly Fe transport [Arenibacter nanhaiticus]